MATLNIDGHSVNVDDSFLKLPPDQQNATVDEIHKSLGSPAPVAPASSMADTATDVAKSAGTGLAKGAIGLAGMVPDISEAAHNAANKYLFDPLLNATVGKPSNPEVPTPDINKAAGSEGIQKAIEGVTGDFHKPSTTAGQYAQTIGEFAPAALGGGEGLLSKVASRVVAPAVASETAGQATAGTGLEPYARVGAAIAGGGLASALSKSPELAAPTVDELKASYRGGINHPDVKAVTINPDSLADLHDTITSDLENRGFRARRESNTFGDLNELSNPAPTAARAAGAPATIDDVESIRKSLGKTSQQVGPDFRPTSDASAASAAIKHIDSWYNNLKQPDLLSGDISKAAPILQDARGDYAAAMRADTIQKKISNAETQAGTTFGGGNINNATRQALRPLIRNDFAKASGYTDAEKQALKTAANGTVVGNIARLVGKLGPDAGLKGIAHASEAISTGGASIPVSLAGLVARKIGDASTAKGAANLDAMLRARSPLHQANLASVNNPTIASRVTPGVTLPNPNYVPPNPAPGALPSSLVAAMLAGQGNRLRSP